MGLILEARSPFVRTLDQRDLISCVMICLLVLRKSGRHGLEAEEQRMEIGGWMSTVKRARSSHNTLFR